MSMAENTRPMGTVRSISRETEQPILNAAKKKADEKPSFKSKVIKSFYQAIAWIKNNRIHFYRIIALACLFGFAWAIYWLAINYTIWGALISFGLSGTETIVTP